MIKLLFRQDDSNQEEFEEAKKHFEVVEHRTACKDSKVIGRYSVLPYYKELETDLKNLGSTLVNTTAQHEYIADFQYYYDIEDHTPKTYFGDWQYIPEGRYVVKGKTNSRKFEWLTKMYAPTKPDAIRIACDLMNDLMVGPQGIVIRKFEDLVSYGNNLNGAPFANEWRFFFLGNELLSYGYYWSNSEVEGKITPEGIIFAKEMAAILSLGTNFFVVDIAQKIDGSWIVVEVNDGQMSGLSNNDPRLFYTNLKKVLENK